MSKIVLIFINITFLILFWSISDTIFAERKLTLLFAGDAMQHQKQIDSALRDSVCDYSECFKYVKDEISAADLSIVNLETVLGGKPYSGYPRFCAPDEFAEALKDAGFDIFLLANNHILDRHSKGLKRTVETLDSLEVFHTGAFKDENDYLKNNPLFVEKNGFRIALLNYTYGINGYKAQSPCKVNLIDREQMKIDIAKAKEYYPDAIIANMHWGIEYKLTPNYEQKELAEFLANEGVDLIIGSHPHVVQPSVVFTDTLGRKHAVVYSLGNLISSMYAENTYGGQIVKIILEKNDNETAIEACKYMLFYVDQKTSGNKNDFVVIPVSLAEKSSEQNDNPPIIELNSRSYNKMELFLKNARKIFDENNQGFSEYFLK